MIEISNTRTIDESELIYEFVRAGGPGGQNVNKVASGVQLRWDVNATESLDEAEKKRLTRLAGKRMTANGVLVIDARRYRTQESNRQDAIERLIVLLQKAIRHSKIRRPTRPSAAARQKRLSDKKKRAEIKRQRSTHPEEWR